MPILFSPFNQYKKSFVSKAEPSEDLLSTFTVQEIIPWSSWMEFFKVLLVPTLYLETGENTVVVMVCTVNGSGASKRLNYFSKIMSRGQRVYSKTMYNYFHTGNNQQVHTCL